jgi:hypothetical protein
MASRRRVRRAVNCARADVTFERAQVNELLGSWERAMFDGRSVTLLLRRSGASRATGTLPWQLVVLLIGFAALSIVLARLYPDVFGAPFERF